MQSIDTSVTICGKLWKNPICTASGTFSWAESSKWYNPEILGAVTLKGVAPEKWEGNPTPRIAETYGGMINSVGLQNPGVESFIKNDLPLFIDADVIKIANVAGHTTEEYLKVVERLNDTALDMLEINISCPNVACGGIGFGTDPKMAADIVRAVKKVSRKPIIVKLTPNVTNISEIAKAVEGEGADAVSLINTLLGMKIDVYRSCPVIKNRVGGLSGPAIKPVAVRMVYEVRKAVKIPIIGMGGISTGEDAAEFIMAGANAVAVGTAGLCSPTAPVDILKQLTLFMIKRNFKNIKEIRDSFLEQEEN